MIAFEIAAELTERLNQFVESLRVHSRAQACPRRCRYDCLGLDAGLCLLGLVVVDRGGVLERLALRINLLTRRFQRVALGVIEGVGGGGLFLLVEKVIEGLIGECGGTRGVVLFVFGCSDGLEAGLELPVCDLLDVVDQIGEVLPLIETALVLRTPGAQEGDEGLVDEIDHKMA